jgi:hypothetical protein
MVRSTARDTGGLDSGNLYRRFVLVGPPGVGKSTVGHFLHTAIESDFEDEDPLKFCLSVASSPDEPHGAALSQIDFLCEKIVVELGHRRGILWQEIDSRYCHSVWTVALDRLGVLTETDRCVVDRAASIIEAACPLPTAWISLELDRNTLMRRVVERGRNGEVDDSGIRTGFQELLDVVLEEHTSFLEGARTSLHGATLRVNAGGDPAVVAARVLEGLKELSLL